MIIIAVIVILILVSVGMSFLSLKNMQKMHEVAEVKEDLSRSKILYQNHFSSESHAHREDEKENAS